MIDLADVERLAEAMWNAARNPDNATWQEMTTRPGTTSGDLYRNRAARLIREYAALAPDPLSPQWESCKVCLGDHWTKDHNPSPHGPGCGHDLPTG